MHGKQDASLLRAQLSQLLSGMHLQTPLKGQRSPPLYFSAPAVTPLCVMCEQDGVCVEVKEEVAEKRRASGEMSSVCRLQFHHTSPSIPAKAPSGDSSISLVCTCDRDTARLSKKPFGDILPVALPCLLQPTLAVHPLSESSVFADAVYLSKSPW